MAPLANTAWLASCLPAYARFCQALRNPAETQQKILRRYLAANRSTSFGSKYHFDKIKSYADFAKTVPLAVYEDLSPLIDRIRQGEFCVLTREPVRRLVPTSGSSSARKLIPFTGGLQREFNAAIGPWLVDLARKHPGMVSGPAYWSISPIVEVETEESALPIGFDADSQYLGGMRQRLAESTMAVPSAIRHAPDMETFRHLTLLSLLHCENLRFISIWHPSFLTLLLDALPGCWNDLLEDIATGQCQRADALPPRYRALFQSRPRPARAKYLAVAEPNRPETLWPHLKVISCWADGQAGLSLPGLQSRFPQVAIQPKGLLATEAFVTIPFRALHPLAIGSHFFEFIARNGTVRLAHELKTGATYEVVVTTAGGLWRYRLGDMVEVDGFVDRTPSLRFLGRAGNVSDLCGEKLSEAFVAQTIQEACATPGLVPRFAMLAPEQSADGPHYTLYFEGETTDALLPKLETGLRRNPHYACCRDLGQLGPLNLWRIAHGGHEAYLAAEMAAGRKLGDIKPHALSRRTDWSKNFSARAEPTDSRCLTRARQSADMGNPWAGHTVS